jgi:hypothetical protein
MNALDINEVEIKKIDNHGNNKILFKFYLSIVLLTIVFILLLFLFNYFFTSEDVHPALFFVYYIIFYLTLILILSLYIISIRENKAAFLLKNISKNIFYSMIIFIAILIVFLVLHHTNNLDTLYFSFLLTIIWGVVVSILIIKNYKQNSIMTNEDLEIIEKQVKEEFIQKHSYIKLDINSNQKIDKETGLAIAISFVIYIINSSFNNTMFLILMSLYIPVLFVLTFKLIKYTVKNKTLFFILTVIFDLIIGTLIFLVLLGTISLPQFLTNEDIKLLIILFVIPFIVPYKNYILSKKINQ